MYVLTITVHTVGVPMKATSPWQIAREFTRDAQAPAAPADNATPRERAVHEVRERAAAGKQTGGHRRFGWLPADRADGRPHNHLLDPDESPYLREAIEMILAGKSERTVTRWLVDHQVPTVRGGTWTGTTVRNMVSNPAVCGYRMLGGALVLDPATGEPVVGGWETIATPEEWRRVLRRYGGGGGSPGVVGAGGASGGSSGSGSYGVFGTSGTSGTSGASGASGAFAPGTRAPERKQIAQTRKYVLSGFLRCGRVGRSGEVCGATLVGNPVTRGTPHGTYACTSPRCRGLARRMDLVDETITALVLDELERRYGAGGAQRWHVDAGDAPGVPVGPDPLLAGFTRERWAGFDLRQKRIAIGTVVEAVTVRPLPEGRSTRAPFDPSLLDVAWLATA